MRYLKFDDPIFNATIYYFSDCDFKMAKNSMKLLEESAVFDDEEERIDANGTVINFEIDSITGGKATQFLVWSDCHDSFVVNHELIHLTKRILESRGIPFNEMNEELIAYLHEFYSRTIFETDDEKYIALD